MLDNNALSQLKQLKQEIEDAKEYGEGTIKGTQRRFGFVVLDDGREIFLAPEHMERVFPGDRVKSEIHTDDKGKQSAELIKLMESPLQEFSGRYHVKGKGHFVEPDLPRFNRWIFVPPQARNGAKSGDYIRAKIARHGFNNSKPQAKILRVHGALDKPGIEAEYMIGKFDLGLQWPKNWAEQLQEDSSEREDLTNTPFISIDAESTRDIDDALYCEANDTGWKLMVAIADPAAVIAPGSALDKEAERRATSVYLPGGTVAMLPEELANDRCSLLPEQTRPALLCQISVDQEGCVTESSMTLATICSSGRYSYQQASAVIAGEENAQAEGHQGLLEALNGAANALLARRQKEHIVVPPRPEFRLKLNEQGKVDRIEPLERTPAHQLVEECMIAANRAAADFIGEKGLFNAHAGFRSERIEGINKLAEEQLGLQDIDFSEPSGYLQLIHAIDDSSEFPVRSVLSRMLERGRISATPAPHVGMGLERYTTFTSPIRRYSDLLVHRLIRTKLTQSEAPEIDQDRIEQLQQRLDDARQANNQVQRWLECQYLDARIGESFAGTVTQVNSNGFTVRISEGIEGFVDTRLIKEKYSFDPLRLRLSGPDRVVELDQDVEVVLAEVDGDRRFIRLELPVAEK